MGLLEEKKICVTDYIVATEDHKEEGTHLHVYLALDKRFETTNQTLLDIRLEDDVPTYHGNYQVVKTDRDVIKYVTKDGNYISSDSYDNMMLKNE